MKYGVSQMVFNDDESMDATGPAPFRAVQLKLLKSSTQMCAERYRRSPTGEVPQEKSLGGGEYFLTFTDDKSRYTWVYVLKSKDQVFEVFSSGKLARKVIRPAGDSFFLTLSCRALQEQSKLWRGRFLRLAVLS